MFSRRTPDTRVLLALIILLFLAVTAWRWALRAGRMDASTAPTPAAGPVPAAQSSAAGAPGPR